MKTDRLNTNQFSSFLERRFEEFTAIFGKQPAIVKKQREIDPQLQRTLASGNEQGVTKGTPVPNFQVVQAGIVRLRNRKVPLNSLQLPKRKVPTQRASPLDANEVQKQKNQGR